MANGRGNRRKVDSGRDAGGFVALPWSVLDSAAYQGLSHPARSLLMELARQYVRGNNGSLLTSNAYLGTRGWKSHDTITRAKRELIDAGFVHETAKGQRPNKAGWYAITWRVLDRLQGYDPGAAESFKRSTYGRAEPIPSHGTRSAPPSPPYGIGATTGTPAETRQTVTDKPLKSYTISPSHGIEAPAIAPSHGIESAPPIPSHGTMEAVFDASPIPSDGNHLDKPSTAEHQADASNDEGAQTTRRTYRPRGEWKSILIAALAQPRTVVELEAMGIARPAARIHDLRADGLEITLERVGRFSRYCLASVATSGGNVPETA